MKNIYLNIYKPNLLNLKKAKKNLENNNVIGFPTETVYGLAANAYSDKSTKKIYKLKKRPFFNPLIIHYKNLNVHLRLLTYNGSDINTQKVMSRAKNMNTPYICISFDNTVKRSM